MARSSLRLVALAALLSACPKDGPTLPPRRDAPPRFEARQEVRLVLVGDTGKPGRRMRRVARAVRAEKKDLVVALGDLVYPVAPRCPTGRVDGEAQKILDERIGHALLDLGAPVLLVLGNHDVGFGTRNPAREACLLDYAASRSRLMLPGLSYSVDLGIATLQVLNTNALTDEDGRRVREEIERHPGWKIVIGHHTLRTYHDKEEQDVVMPWLRRHRIRPDLYVNGHAHLLQFGVYDGIPALTSGSASRLRRRPACPPACGRGQLWGRSVSGYATLHVRAKSLEVAFKDDGGKDLWRWVADRSGGGASR
jgi:predicted phosphodiesterase